MKRRGFLKLLGFAPVAAAAAKLVEEGPPFVARTDWSTNDGVDLLEEAVDSKRAVLRGLPQNVKVSVWDQHGYLLEEVFGPDRLGDVYLRPNRDVQVAIYAPGHHYLRFPSFTFVAGQEYHFCLPKERLCSSGLTARSLGDKL